MGDEEPLEVHHQGNDVVEERVAVPELGDGQKKPEQLEAADDVADKEHVVPEQLGVGEGQKIPEQLAVVEEQSSSVQVELALGVTVIVVTAGVLVVVALEGGPLYPPPLVWRVVVELAGWLDGVKVMYEKLVVVELKLSGPV